jgi:alkanesulfonate monooxygenase SsuD/methylene tetrahydromethanopterin reductase-like flavin-dependent oxidoreductase (luciferase family)
MSIDAVASPKPDPPRATFGLIISANYENERDLGARIAEHREQVGLARQAGFTSVVCNQHFLMHPVSSLATIPYLASVIDISGDMKLAIGVALLPLLSPVLLAEEVATLDWLSGGRAVLGLAMGYRPPEFEAMGVSLRDRLGRFSEGLAVMQAIWSADPTWSFQGKHYRYESLPGGLKPKQQPHPPLWIAADVDAAVRRAGRLGAAWYPNPRAGLSSLARQVAVYEQALREHGHQTPEIFPIRRELFIAPSDQEARRTAIPHLERQLAQYESWGQFEAMPAADQPARAFGEHEIPDAFLVGSPMSLAEQIERYVEALGVNHFVVKIQWDGMSHRQVMRSIELIGAELTPRLA